MTVEDDSLFSFLSLLISVRGLPLSLLLLLVPLQLQALNRQNGCRSSWGEVLFFTTLPDAPGRPQVFVVLLLVVVSPPPSLLSCQ